MNELISCDEKLFLYLNNLGSPAFDPFWILLSEKFFWIPLYVIFLYFLIKNFSKRNLLYILVFIALGIAVSDQLAGVYKVGIMRLRPCHTPYLQPLMRAVECGGQFGFYSSHASNSFFLANFLSILLKNKVKFFGIFIFLWAALVSYSRIYIGVHFPMDIITGGLAGFLLGGLFATLCMRTFR